MKNKIMAALIVAVFVAMAVPIMTASDSDAVAGQNVNTPFKVWIYDETDPNVTTNVYTVDAYDAYQALVASGIEHTVTANTLSTENEMNDSWNIGIYSEGSGWTYYYPNAEYGTLATINGKAVDGDVFSWYTFVFHNALVVGSWEPAQDAIGWYRPFTDYSATTVDGQHSWKSANIAFVYAESEAEAESQLPGTFTRKQALTNPSGNADFMHVFYLQCGEAYSPDVINKIVRKYDPDTKNVTNYSLMNASDVHNGIYVVGYGSDANLALREAVNVGTLSFVSNLVFGSGDNYLSYNIAPMNPTGPVGPTYYSWMESLYGLSDNSTVVDGQDGWAYWASYYGDDHTAGNYCSYNFGYYSAIDNGYTDWGSDMGNHQFYKLQYEFYPSSW
jgi:hypothetical protein